MNKSRWAPAEGPVWPWRLGQIAQGLVIGVCLVFVVIGILAMANNATAFAYQGF